MDLGDEDAPRLLDLTSERRIDEVRGGHAGVQMTRIVARGLGDHAQERDDVVMHLGLDRQHARQIDPGTGADALDRARGHLTATLARAGRRQFHLEPEREATFVRPYGGHLGTTVAIDHVSAAPPRG